MKFGKLYIITLLFITSIVPMSAQSISDKEILDSSRQNATLYLYRGKSVGWLPIAYCIYANGNPLCKLLENRYCKVSLPAGKTILSTRRSGFKIGNKESQLEITLKPNEVYYVQGDRLITSPLTDTMVLTEVVPNSAKLDQIHSAKQENSNINIRK